MYIIQCDPGEAHSEAEFTLGQLGADGDGNIYRYFRANGAIAQYAAVEIEASYHSSDTNARASNANFGQPVGVVQAALADDEYGWALVNGKGRVLAKASAGAYAQMYDHSTDGYIEDATSTNASSIGGLVLSTARGSSDGNAPCVAIWPHYTS